MNRKPSIVNAEPNPIDLIRPWRESGYSIGFTNGCFDLIHPGHISLLHRAKNECDKWVHEGGTYLTWKKDWKLVDGGMQRKWKIKRVSKRVCQIDQLSNQFIGLEYQVRNGKVLSKSEIIGKRHQLIIKRTFLFKP